MAIDDLINELYESTSSYLARSEHEPLSTYRLQLNHLFKFNDATNILSYLHELGITDCYCSPYLKARQGSMHGYDISDHNALNPEIGSPKDYNRFVEQLGKHRMGHILDFVPNHMGIFNNHWWQDVLENGPSSPYSTFFDIDWAPVKAELHQKVLLPVLEDLYGKVLDEGHITISFDKGNFIVTYRGLQLPTDPKSATMILEPCLRQLEVILGENNADYIELQSILTALSNLPDRSEIESNRMNERRREKEVIKRRLRELYSKNGRVKRVIQLKLQEINAKQGNGASFDALHKFLEEQVYRLSFWRVAGEEINYRRFFDINELVALTMEDTAVFEATHKLVLSLLASGKVTGLRIDHVDGLFSPSDYLWHLQKNYFVEVCLNRAAHHYSLDQTDITLLRKALLKRVEDDQAERSLNNASFKPLYVLVEKILVDQETLRQNWPVAGTTGYEYSSVLNGLFVNRKNATAIRNTYRWFTGQPDTFPEVVYRCKNLVMRTSMAAELNVLAHHLNRNSERSRLYRDLTLNNLRDAIRETIACFPVYRTYINAFVDCADETDRSVINMAIAEAKKQNPAISAAVFDFLRSTLLLDYPADIDEEGRDEQRLFVMRFQQFTGPVMAKGMEDTAFYIYNPLISLNEVGGNPQRFGSSIEEFHKHNIRRLKTLPFSMISTSTHDSKRSEDVRARINVLSEMPQQWRSALMRWSRVNRDKKAILENEYVPDSNVEYYLYQTILGTYPTQKIDGDLLAVYQERIQQHMLKAVREAKIHTSWISPNIAYEENILRFIEDILRPVAENIFLTDLISFNGVITTCGIYNSLSQAVLKIFSPGVPDIYHGNEIWKFNLTDPDNRRLIDFPRRIKLLKQLKRRLSESGNTEEFIQELLSYKEDGGIKLYVTWKSLIYRLENAELFKGGAYVPMQVIGDKGLHVCAFSWQNHGKKCLVAAPVLLAGLTQNAKKSPMDFEAWGETYIVLPKEQAGQVYSNIFTYETIGTVQQENANVLPLAEIFKTFPVAVLELLPE